MQPIDVFISYKREERAVAEALAGYLSAQGYRVWWDAELLSGDNFILEIFEVLKSAKSAVILWSEQALSSRFVIGEALFALNRQIYVGASPNGSIELPPPFNAVHFENISAWQSGTAAFARLLPAIARKAGTPTVSGSADAEMRDAVAEAVFWRGIADSNEADGYRAYLDKHGDKGIFSELAKRRLASKETAKPRLSATAPATVDIPAGAFFMGSPGDCLEGDDDERPVHRVTFARSSRIGAAPVAFSEYDVFTEATGRRAAPDHGMPRGNHPAVNVTWHDANDYCRWLSSTLRRSFRLPSEAEWEYAARAGSASARPWGANWNAAMANGAVAVGRTSPPGTYPANAFGVLDTIGNVWEWCADPSHQGYAGAPCDGSVWLADGDLALRVIRGGSFDDLPQALRSAMRGWYRPEDRAIRIGFRVVEDVSA
jgi:formylglycine-generating enzyme required for sulfatase activity